MQQVNTNWSEFGSQYFKTDVNLSLTQPTCHFYLHFISFLSKPHSVRGGFRTLSWESTLLSQFFFLWMAGFDLKSSHSNISLILVSRPLNRTW